MSILQEVHEELSFLQVPLHDHPVDTLESFLKADLSGLQEVEDVGPDVRLIRDGKVYHTGEYEIQPFVVITGPVILGKNVRIGPWSFLRGPLYLGDNVQIGPHCELVRSIILSGTRLAHIDYIADSIIGRDCWLAGVVGTANLKTDNKPTKVKYNKEIRHSEKFGAVIDSGTIVPSMNLILPGVHVQEGAKLNGPGLVYRMGRHMPFIGEPHTGSSEAGR